jgi:hypothetical protein
MMSRPDVRIPITKGAVSLSGRRALSLAQVRSVGLPAVYLRFGDALLYLDETLFDLNEPDPGSPTLFCPPVLDATILQRAVGIEFGWRHALGCRCRFCAAEDDLSEAA